MAVRARLSAPRPQEDKWPWHIAAWLALPVTALAAGERRLEAETYLHGGYGIRLALEAQRGGWARFGQISKVWQPSRLKGIQVSPEVGTPFLAATQVFDLQPVPRKWLSLNRTEGAAERFAKPGTILVSCSGSVGRVTLATRQHEGVLISHDLLRIEPTDQAAGGWLYAYLRSAQVRAMMTAAHYGHVIKHIEPAHLAALPIPIPKREILDGFNHRLEDLLKKRNRTEELMREGHGLYEEAIGPVDAKGGVALGFSVSAQALFTGRRRLEAEFYSPAATAILNRFRAKKLRVESLGDVTARIWRLTQFKRVFGDEGAPYMSADELFALNPTITKRVVVEQADNADDFFVKAGWIVMARSGQTYGLNGSVALMTKRHESAFLSDDFIRIMPHIDRIRPGYLFTALGHPTLGRPLVVRCAYGTSIPHLDPPDVAACPIVRLGSSVENTIADRMEETINLRAEADEMENALAADAEDLTRAFLAGDQEPFDR